MQSLMDVMICPPTLRPSTVVVLLARFVVWLFRTKRQLMSLLCDSSHSRRLRHSDSRYDDHKSRALGSSPMGPAVCRSNHSLSVTSCQVPFASCANVGSVCGTHGPKYEPRGAGAETPLAPGGTPVPSALDDAIMIVLQRSEKARGCGPHAKRREQTFLMVLSEGFLFSITATDFILG